MDEKTILVTGSTDGIGLAAARELARRGQHVIVHGRNTPRAEQVVRELERDTKHQNIDFVVGDFASLAQVRRMAQDVNQRFPQLDVLINNAGVIMKKRVLTEDGYETTWQVNHLAPFLLTNLLLDLIRRSAPARVVTVSSGTHRSGRLDWNNLSGAHRFDSYNAYATSKLANVLFAFELAERLAGSGVTSNALHPGVINTKLLRAGFSPFGDKVDRGAEGLVYLAMSPKLEGVTGKYFDLTHEATAAPAAHDVARRKKLWQVSEELVSTNSAVKNTANE